MNKYEVIIYWSEEDQVFVAEVPELPGDPFRVLARGEPHGGGGVARLVGGPAGEAKAVKGRVPDALGHAGMVEGSSRPRAEDKGARMAGDRLLGSKGLQDGRQQVDVSDGGVGLGRAETPPVQRPADSDLPIDPVDVLPPQAVHLSSAHSREEADDVVVNRSRGGHR